LSEWQYFCELGWLLVNEQKWDIAARPDMLEHGQCPKYHRASPSDKLQVDDYNVEGFRRYGGDDSYEFKFNRSFKWTGANRVNCWVKVENLQADALKCVTEYSKQTHSPVNHKAFQSVPHANSGTDYGSCQKYFDPMKEQDMRKKCSFLFNYFHYEQCCSEKHSQEDHFVD